MPIWTAPEVEATLRVAIDPAALTEQVLEHLVSSGAREGEQLEFKGPLSSRPKGGPAIPWTPEQEFGKDVAALANHRGGLLILGVREIDGVATELKPYSGTTAEAEETRLRQAVLNHVAPQPATVFVPVPATVGGPSGTTTAGAFYLVIVVLPSPRAPHAVTALGDGMRPLRFPVRHGADIMWLTESEVAERYRRRFDALAAGDRHVAQVVDEGRRELRPAQGVWLYVAAVPEVLREATLDAAEVAAADAWVGANSLGSPLVRSLLVFGQAFPAPGKTVFTNLPFDDTSEVGDPVSGYVELHADGCAFAPTSILERTGESAGRQVGQRTLADDLVVAADAVLAWVIHQAGSGGPVRLVAGLVDAESEYPDALTAPLELVSVAFGGDLRRVSGTRLLRRAPRVTSTASLAQGASLQERMAVAATVHSGLLQWFGVAESAQIGRDGALLTAGWGSYAGQVERWARDHSVAAR